MLYIRREIIDVPKGIQLQAEAESLMSGREYEIPPPDIFETAAGSACSAYDCEFVALAKSLAVSLYTLDRKLVESFPDTALTLPE